MKTAEELNALKEEVETLNKKLAELTDEELSQVSGGAAPNKPGIYQKHVSGRENFHTKGREEAIKRRKEEYNL